MVGRAVCRFFRQTFVCIFRQDVGVWFVWTMGVEINNVRSAKQHADFLTKPFTRRRFVFTDL